jgi:hypothetical protein
MWRYEIQEAGQNVTIRDTRGRSKRDDTRYKRQVKTWRYSIQEASQNVTIRDTRGRPNLTILVKFDWASHMRRTKLYWARHKRQAKLDETRNTKVRSNLTRLHKDQRPFEQTGVQTGHACWPRTLSAVETVKNTLTKIILWDRNRSNVEKECVLSSGGICGSSRGSCTEGDMRHWLRIIYREHAALFEDHLP